MDVFVDDPAFCRGCSFFDNNQGKCSLISDADGKSVRCERLRIITTDGPSVVCSNMRVSDRKLAGKNHGYRLTTGDIVFLSEWGGVSAGVLCA